ncbi:MAG: hypothetical protein V2A73_17950, partial [Pseudomonadota bacterium]
DIDDLEKVVAGNLRDRQAEAARAEGIVEAEAQQLMAWLRSQELVPTIRDLRERFHQVANIEVELLLSNLRGELDQRKEAAIRRLGETIVNKLLHTPLSALKQSQSGDMDTDVLLAATRQLFALSAPSEAGPESPRSSMSLASPTSPVSPAVPVSPAAVPVPLAMAMAAAISKSPVAGRESRASACPEPYDSESAYRRVLTPQVLDCHLPTDGVGSIPSRAERVVQGEQ